MLTNISYSQIMALLLELTHHHVTPDSQQHIPAGHSNGVKDTVVNQVSPIQQFPKYYIMCQACTSKEVQTTSKEILGSLMLWHTLDVVPSASALSKVEFLPSASTH